MKNVLLLTAIGCTFAFAVCAVLKSSTEAEKPNGVSHSVTGAVAPVLHFEANSKMEIRVDFENTSQRTVRYLLGHYPLAKEGGGMAYLHFLLYKDGRFIEPLETQEPPELAKRRVRDLKPGERVPHLLKLWNVYGDLEAGSYELRARYQVYAGSVSETEYGITPMSFERTVAFIEIEEREKGAGLPSLTGEAVGPPISEPELYLRASYGTRAVKARVVGVPPEYLYRNRLKMRHGRFFSQPDLKNRKSVVVLSSSTAEKLFPNEDTLGKSIHLREQYYVVIGVSERRRPRTPAQETQATRRDDYEVYLPLDTMWARMGPLIMSEK